MLLPSQTSWVILAGGQASRMGGDDKGLIRLNDKPLIEHVIQRLQPQTDHLLINANRNHQQYQRYAPVIADQFSGYPGPLSGIHAGLCAAPTDWVGFVPCDSPMIATDLVIRFCAAVTPLVDIVVATDGQHRQPVFTLAHKRIIPGLTHFLEGGERKVSLFYRQCHTVEVDFSDTPDCFFNLNTPQDLAQFGALQP